MRVFVAAYTLAPSGIAWDADLETQYFNGLKKIDGITGLEIPVGANFHPHDEAWFLQNIDPDWRFVVTCMPSVMADMANNPHCGIASDDADGRRQAVEFYQSVRLSVLKLQAEIGLPVVDSIQLHGAPNRNAVKSSSGALASSLREMSSWDWGGAQLVLEHCDAASSKEHADKPVEKGFLSIDEEIQAVTQLNREYGTSIKLSVNWGRSAIETRSVEGPIEHISKLATANLLYGASYSGVSDQTGPYGAWRDTHAPFAPYPDVTDYLSESLLTREELARCLHATESTHSSFVGLKIAAKPNTLDVAQRIAYYRDAVTILEHLNQ